MIQLFNKIYQKPCPHCENIVDTRDLKIVPFTGKLRWNQFTPPSRLECPKCHKLVKSTFGNSRWIILPFFWLVAGLWLPTLFSFYPSFATPAFSRIVYGLVIGMMLLGVFLAFKAAQLEADDEQS